LLMWGQPPSAAQPDEVRQPHTAPMNRNQ